MPLKRGAGKKATKKVAASPSGTEVFNNGEKEVPQELATAAKNLQNGNSIDGTYDAEDSVKYNATKRSSGRIKHVTEVLEADAASIKKPPAKGRGKKKADENKVIENEVNGSELATQEVEVIKANEVTSKPKGRGGGKKLEPKKKSAKPKENKIELSSAEIVKEEPAIKIDGTDLPEKNAKVVGGRKKKQNDTSKTEEPIEEQHLEKEVKEEKTSPKNLSRDSKKTKDLNAEVEPQKKKGKTSKKEKTFEKDDVEVKADEIEADVKEKKPIKRGRANTKAVTAEDGASALNGDTDEVLPKKRSRKAPSVEKEIIKEKSNKKGRAKKSDKGKEKFDEDAEIQGKGEIDSTANVKSDEREEQSSSNSQLEKQIDSVVEPPTAAAKRAKGGRKRAAPSNNKKTSITTADDDEKLDDGVNNAELEDEADGSKPSKTKKGKTDTALINSTVTKYNKADFDLSPPIDGQTVEEPRFNFKISSWNVAGLRSWLKKDGLEFLNYEQPDIFCMQETKCSNDQLPEEVVRIPGYHPYWLCMPGGYAGVAIYSKIMPIHVEYGIGSKEFDDCGRIITAEYEKFFLINVYVPNSGRKLVNLEARMKWEKLFQQFIQNLDARKPVVICGDMNVSHQEQDLANPKSNTRNAGFTKEERNKMTELLALGYIDTFRHLYPERKGAYTYWTYMANARSRNVGWRLDYFIVSERFIKRVVDNCIRSQCMGSDHCPITLFLKL